MNRIIHKGKRVGVIQKSINIPEPVVQEDKDPFVVISDHRDKRGPVTMQDKPFMMPETETETKSEAPPQIQVKKLTLSQILTPPNVKSLMFTRHGYIGEELARALTVFSLDVVGIVAQYAQEFRLLRTLGTRELSSVAATSIAVDGKGFIYTAESTGIYRYDPHGQKPTKLISCAPVALIANIQKNQVIVLTKSRTYENQKIYVVNCDDGCTMDILHLHDGMRSKKLWQIREGRAQPYTKTDDRPAWYTGTFDRWFGILIDAVGNVYVMREVRRNRYRRTQSVEVCELTPIFGAPEEPSNPVIHSNHLFRPPNKLSANGHFLQMTDCENQVIMSADIDEEYAHLPDYEYLEKHAVAASPQEHSIYVSTHGRNVAKVYII